MKILEINMFDKVLGGAERYISTLGHEVIRMGHELVHVYINKQDGPGELISGINTYYIPHLSICGCGDFMRGRFSRAVRDGLDILREIVREERPDIIHVHNVYYPVFLDVLRKFCPVIRTIHDYRFLCPNLMKLQIKKGEICNANVGIECFKAGCLDCKKPVDYRTLMFILFEREKSMGYDRYIVKSRHMRDVLLSNGFDRNKISVQPLCTEIIEIKGDSLPRNRILFAGRFAPEKGLDILCNVLKSLPMDFKATFAGSGIIENDIMRLVIDLGLSDRVDFVGWLSPQELSKAYLESTVVVIPSMWPEPFGLVGLEAMAHGRPVVAFNVGGVIDWLEHGKTGFLVTRGDAEGLLKWVTLILENPNLAAFLGKNGRIEIAKRFNIQKNAEDLLKIYKAVVGKRKEIDVHSADSYWRVKSLEEAKKKIIEPYKGDESFEKSGKSDVEYIIRIANITNKLKVLEIGCGIGRVSKYLSNRCKLIMHDPSPEMIKYSYEYFFDSTPRLTRLDKIKDGYFNVIFSVITIQHLSSDASLEIFKEVERLLAKDGVFIFNVHEYYVDTDEDKEHCRDIDTIRYMLDLYNLEIEKIDKVNVNYWFTVRRKNT